MPDTAEVISSKRFQEIWQKMNHNMRRYAVARLEYSQKKEAAVSVGITAETVYRWPDFVEEAVAYLLLEARNSAMDILESGVVRAAMLKLEGMEVDDDDLQQKIASEVLDRVLGRATQRTELTGADGDGLNIHVTLDD
jgi:hypothetical protein